MDNIIQEKELRKNNLFLSGLLDCTKELLPAKDLVNIVLLIFSLLCPVFWLGWHCREWVLMSDRSQWHHYHYKDLFSCPVSLRGKPLTCLALKQTFSPFKVSPINNNPLNERFSERVQISERKCKVDHLGIEITLKVTWGEKRNNCKMKPKERLMVSLLLWSLLILQTSGETRHKRGGESDRKNF